jgi:large subunit ribosomal protein L25
MLTLKADQRKEKGRKVAFLRKKSQIPAVLYGPALSTLSVSVGEKEFNKVYQEAGASSLLNLHAQGKAIPVLIHDVQRDPVSSKVIHVDFYQPPLDKKIEITVPIVFEGEAPAVKELEGTLIQNIHEVEVFALPQDLPHEITVAVAKLVTFADYILIKNLEVPSGVQVLNDQEAIIAQVVPAEKVEEELAKPAEENVEDVKVVKEEKKQKDEVEAAAQEPAKEKK